MAATAPAPAPEPAIHELPRALGLRDLVLFNIVAVLSLRWLATAAAAGPSSITLWVLAGAALLRAPGARGERPVGSRYPERGRDLLLDQARPSARGTASSAAGATGSTTSSTIPTC